MSDVIIHNANRLVLVRLDRHHEQKLISVYTLPWSLAVPNIYVICLLRKELYTLLLQSTMPRLTISAISNAEVLRQNDRYNLLWRILRPDLQQKLTLGMLWELFPWVLEYIRTRLFRLKIPWKNVKHSSRSSWLFFSMQTHNVLGLVHLLEYSGDLVTAPK